ncbi:MAG TPA: hypothetical protein VLA12_22930, partial [Planctomycetaceae bacterium]|nr:hypothetical protein [Planctomycetaceae bacterium]
MIKMIYIIALLFCILLLILPFLPSQMGPHKTRARISHTRENIRYMMQAIGSYDSEHHTLKGIQEDPIACVEEFRRRNIAYR